MAGSSRHSRATVTLESRDQRLFSSLLRIQDFHLRLMWRVEVGIKVTFAMAVCVATSPRRSVRRAGPGFDGVDPGSNVHASDVTVCRTEFRSGNKQNAISDALVPEWG